MSAIEVQAEEIKANELIYCLKQRQIGMSNDALNFHKVLAAFRDYLSQADYVEVVKTSRDYAFIDWDDYLNT